MMQKKNRTSSDSVTRSSGVSPLTVVSVKKNSGLSEKATRIGAVAITALILTAALASANTRKMVVQPVLSATSIVQEVKQVPNEIPISQTSSLVPIESKEEISVQQDISVGKIVKMDETMKYYASSDQALRKQNPTVVGEYIYPGDYEINYIAVLKENGDTYQIIKAINDSEMTIGQMKAMYPNYRYAVHIKIIDGRGQVNDIGWLDSADIQVVKDRGGSINEYTNVR